MDKWALSRNSPLPFPSLQDTAGHYPTVPLIADIGYNLYPSLPVQSFSIFSPVSLPYSSSLQHTSSSWHVSHCFARVLSRSIYAITAPNPCQLVLLSSHLILSLHLLASPGSFLSLSCHVFANPIRLSFFPVLNVCSFSAGTEDSTLYVQIILLLNYLQSTGIQTSSCIGSITLHHLKQGHQTKQASTPGQSC